MSTLNLIEVRDMLSELLDDSLRSDPAAVFLFLIDRKRAEIKAELSLLEFAKEMIHVEEC